MFKQVKQSYIRRLVEFGKAKDVTFARDRNAIPEHYESVLFSVGKYGCNGLVFRGVSGNLYAIKDYAPSIKIL